jgi:hypothetical protein
VTGLEIDMVVIGLRGNESISWREIERVKLDDGVVRVGREVAVVIGNTDVEPVLRAVRRGDSCQRRKDARGEQGERTIAPSSSASSEVARSQRQGSAKKCRRPCECERRYRCEPKGGKRELRRGRRF